MFCDRLRACRIARNYTLQEMADAVDISLRTYQKYEGGSTFPDFSHPVSYTHLDVYQRQSSHPTEAVSGPLPGVRLRPDTRKAKGGGWSG